MTTTTSRRAILAGAAVDLAAVRAERDAQSAAPRITVRHTASGPRVTATANGETVEVAVVELAGQTVFVYTGSDGRFRTITEHDFARLYGWGDAS